VTVSTSTYRVEGRDERVGGGKIALLFWKNGSKSGELNNGGTLGIVMEEKRGYKIRTMCRVV